MKPESVEMQDVILEDTESEVRNDFVVFEIKGMSRGRNFLQFAILRKVIKYSWQGLKGTHGRKGVDL